MAIIIGLCVVLAAYVIWLFNRLISLRVRASNAWADIDVQLKRRADLVPPLVETVRGYAAHESGTLERAVAARNQTTRATGIAERAAGESRMTREIHHLIALAEAYPNLKADEMFLSLQKSLVEIEDYIQSARRYYNAVVRDYNTMLKQFPHLLIAVPLRFQPREYFEIAEAQSVAPVVDLTRSRP